MKTWRFGHGSRKRALKVAVFKKAQLVENASSTLDPEVASKAAAVALEDGTLAIVDLAVSGSEPPAQTIKVSPSPKALTALAVTKTADRTIIAVGSADGVISLTILENDDLEKPLKIAYQFKRNSADVTALVFTSHLDDPLDANTVCLLASSMDGLLYESVITLNGSSGGVKVRTEYAGYDIDACNAIAQRNGEIYAAGKDGHVRRY